MSRPSISGMLLAALLGGGVLTPACAPVKRELSDGGAGGTGPSTSTGSTATGSTATGSTSSSSSSSSSTSGPDPCLSKPTNATCTQCLTQAYATGFQLYNDVATCVFCTGCYTTCDGAASGCPSAPPAKDACDVSDCGTCQQCSQMGSCQAAATTCTSSPECLQFADLLTKCPQG
jgi:hypothetical protein